MKNKSEWNYKNDVEKLIKLTKGIVTDLDKLSKIRIGDSEVQVTRQCVQELQNQIEERSLILVGEPGVGKSGALCEVAASLLQEEKDTVFLSAGRIDADSLSQLSEQLGLQHELDEILANWTGDSPAFLIIDGLDGVKSEPTMQMLLSFLARLVREKGRWRVIVSIRKFELRQNKVLRQIFNGQPPSETYRDPDFSDLCHVTIPAFSEEECLALAGKSEALKKLLQVDHYKLKELVRVPFHLRLFGELIGNGVPGSELASIRTDLELLDRYWEEQIIKPHDGLSDARILVLWRAVYYMLETRTLIVPKTYVADPETTRALDQMLDKHVLMEWKPSEESFLVFVQDGLFDYAVARMLLRAELEFDERLANHPEFMTAFRPSLNLHFKHLWYLRDNRSSFWEMVLIIIGNQQVPTYGKKIGPAVAAEMCETIFELYSLLQYIDTWREDSAEIALQYVIEALIAVESSDKKAVHLVGQHAGPWAELMEYLSKHFSPNMATMIRPLLLELSKQAKELIEKQLTFSGIAARNLLKFAWAQESRDESLLQDALTCVCRLFHSNPDASSMLLSQVLYKEHVTKYGYLTIPCLAREVKHLILHDPYFAVQDLYIAAFKYEETGEDHQDYQISLEQLGKRFGDFLEQAPVKAVESLIAIIEHHVLTEHNHQHGNVLEKTFIVNDAEAVIRSDLSSIWDTDRHHEVILMLDAFQAYFTKLGMDQGKADLRRRLLNRIAKQNRMAVLWRRLLMSGAAAPALLGQEIKCLAWSLPILTSPDTNEAAGVFIRGIYSSLSVEEREKVEQAIVSIPSVLDEQHREQGESLRDRLLSCLSIDHVRTTEACQLMSERNLFGED